MYQKYLWIKTFPNEDHILSAVVVGGCWIGSMYPNSLICMWDSMTQLVESRGSALWSKGMISRAGDATFILGKNDLPPFLHSSWMYISRYQFSLEDFSNILVSCSRTGSNHLSDKCHEKSGSNFLGPIRLNSHLFYIKDVLFC